MNRELFRTEFTEGSIPNWHCPRCLIGILKLKSDSFCFWDSSDTRNCRDQDFFSYEHVKYTFNGNLFCNHCSETIVFCGTGYVDEIYDRYSDGNPNTPSQYVNIFTPKYFFPPLHIIELPKNQSMSAEIEKIVNKAFEIYWCDADACSTRIRTTLELALERIDGKPLDKNGNPLKLHQRLEKINGKVSRNAEKLMMAIKWSGNAGAHEFDGITTEQVLDAFEMLEFCLKEIYPSEDNLNELLEIATEINEKNRPSR